MNTSLHKVIRLKPKNSLNSALHTLHTIFAHNRCGNFSLEKKAFCIPWRAMLALGRLKPSKFMKIQNLSNIFARRIVVKLFQLHRFTHAKVLLKRSQNLSCLLNDGTDSGGVICGKLDWQHYSTPSEIGGYFLARVIPWSLSKVQLTI